MMITIILVVVSVVILLCLLFLLSYKAFKMLHIRNLANNSLLIETSKGEIEYTLRGEQGPVLLHLHGSPGGYDQTMEPGKNYRILTPSRPGYLRTALSNGLSPEEQADCFKALLDALEINKVFVMGVSGGGPSSMQFAARFPQSVYGLILFEAVSYSQDFTKEDEELINASDFALWLQLFSISFLGKQKLASVMLPNKNNRERLLSSQENVMSLKRVIWSIWPMSMRKAGIENDYNQFTELHVPYEKISAPTLIIHGDEDKNVDMDHAKFANSKISRSVLYTVKEGDHMMSATHAKEIEEQIETFVSNNISA